MFALWASYRVARCAANLRSTGDNVLADVAICADLSGQECCVRGMVSIAVDGGPHALDSDEAFVMMCSTTVSSTTHVSSAGMPAAMRLSRFRPNAVSARCAVDFWTARHGYEDRWDTDRVASMPPMLLERLVRKSHWLVVSRKAEYKRRLHRAIQASLARGAESGYRSHDCRRRWRPYCKRSILFSCAVRVPFAH